MASWKEGLGRSMADGDVTSYCLEVRLDRLERRITRWFQLLAGTIMVTFVVAVGGLLSVHWTKPEVTPAAAPITTAVAARPDYAVGHLNKRVFMWFVAIRAVAIVVNLGFSLYSLATACSSFAESGKAGDGVQCVYGAISTAATAIGLGAKGLAKAGQAAGSVAAEGLQLGLINAGGAVKRDLAIEAYASQISTLFPNMDYQHHGFVHRNSSFNGHLIPEGYDYWPVNTFTNYLGHTMHHMVVPTPNGGTVSRLGFANPNSKRDDLGDQDEYFTSGGLDFTANDGGDTEDINDGDFANMEASIKCSIPDLNPDEGLEVQVLDATKEETTGAGSIAAVGPDGTTAFNSLPAAPNSLTPVDGCDSQYSSSG